MYKMNNRSLEKDVYSILKEGKILRCREVDGRFLIERKISDIEMVEYFYKDKSKRDEDHYQLSILHFKVNS